MDWFSLSESAFGAAVIVYIAATILYLAYLVKQPKIVGRLATAAAIIAVSAHTGGLIFRWIEGGINHPPFTNLYESLLFFSWAIALFYLVVEWRWDFRMGGAFILPVALGAIGAAALSPSGQKEIGTLLPALQSHWLHAHVAVAALAYAAFVAAFGASLMFLIKDGVHKGLMGAWANVFVAFMLLICDRLNILTHRVFTLKAVTETGEATGVFLPIPGAGKLFLVAVFYFMMAAVLYRMGVPAKGEKNKGDKDSGADSKVKLASFAPYVTALGAITTAIGLVVLIRATGYSPQELAALAAQTGENGHAVAEAIVRNGMSLSLAASPFKAIIIGLVIFVATAIVVLDLKIEWIRGVLPNADMLDSIGYTIITIAFPLMTMVIVTGAVWAKYAFGHYWQWDPKETASLITWIIYTAYLHSRVSLNWSDRSVAVISIIGFASVVFTYLGVNVIGPGYHAYASM